MRPRTWWRPQSLSQRLVFGVCCVVTVVVVALGGLYTFYLRSFIIDVSDAQLPSSLDSFGHSLTKLPDADGRPQVLDEDGRDRLVDFGGQSAGTLIAVLRDGKVAASAVFRDADVQPAPSDAVAALESLTWIDGAAPVSARLGSIGDYRVQSRAYPGGDVLVSGMSLDRARDTVARKTAGAAVLTLLALLATVTGSLAAIRFALIPLRNVAATAAEVAKLPLSESGDRITTRVPDRYADETVDIGVVGHTLNLLLDNVDAALAARAETDRRIRRFLADASHELRTPLAAIQGYAELTRQDSAELPATTEYALARIEAESHRMSRLVSDLLLLSRLDERQDLTTEPVDLCELLSNAVNDIAVSAGDHRWQLDVPETPVLVMGDAATLHQLVMNLLANASTHTPVGTTVDVALTTGRKGACIVVGDDGPGIAEELLPRLFERFVQADRSPSNDRGNSGLGLAIVESIAAAHNGSVTVRSSAAGSAFTVVLPEVVDAG